MKLNIKITIDILMTILLLLLSGYQFLSEAMHEWLGVMILICFIVHNALNFKWYQNMTKGNYSIIRKLYLIINILVLISMLIQMYSGIVMSKYVFSFLNIQKNLSFVRKLHILGAYWGLIFIGLHLGMHWNNFIKSMDLDKIKYTKYLGIVIAIYGCYALIKRQFPTYLFLKSEFVFMDFNEFSLYFYIDYLAIMGLCIVISHYGRKLLISKRLRH